MSMWVVSGIFSLATAVFLVQEFTRVSTFMRMGDMWSFLVLRQDTLGVFSGVDERDFVSPPYPSRGDTLLTIDGQPSYVGNYFAIFNTDTPPGLVLPITFTSGDTVLSTQIRTRSIPTEIRIQIIPMMIIRFLIAVSLVATGFWAFLKQPRSPAVRALSLYCYGLVAMLVFARPVIAPTYSAFHLPAETTIIWAFFAFSVLVGPLWLNLNLLFPRISRTYSRFRLPLDLVCYLPAVSLAALLLLSMEAKLGLILQILNTLYFAAGYALLWKHHAQAPSLLEKRQTHLVLWGTTIPGILLFAFGWLEMLFLKWLEQQSFALLLAIQNVQFLSVLLVPVCFAWAFGRYRLLEVEGRIRKGTLFVVVNVLLLAALGLIVYNAGGLLMRLTGASGPAPVLVLSLGLAVGIAPAQKRIRNFLEDRFFPERHRLQVLLRDFLSSTREIQDRKAFWHSLKLRLSDGLHAASIEPVLFSGRDPGAEAIADDGTAPFRRDDEVLRRLAEYGKPMLVDEIVCCGRIAMTQLQIDWLRERGTALLLPLASRGGLLGFMAAGRKAGGEDYTSSDLEILASLSEQIGLAAENIELLGEKLEKERLQEQLQIARRIQKSLLPVEVPRIEGLELAASITFCLDVAGDFYDFVPLPGGKTLISIGDVSGKGVGPALLMANLQASLRAVGGVGIGLPDLMERLNRLVFDATPDEYFITLFAAVWDPSARSLRWVNAGHNPPILITRREMRFLDEGGLLLGVSPTASYREGIAALEPGDLLVMYTDGVSEAMDESEEEYGPDRIAWFAAQGRALPLGAMLTGLEQEVKRFSGSETFADDFTLLAARAT
jgi:serine phosphatase RsbU (regulator of sigma subunit)